MLCKLKFMDREELDLKAKYLDIRRTKKEQRSSLNPFITKSS